MNNSSGGGGISSEMLDQVLLRLKRAGMSRKQIGEALKVTPRSLQRYVSGERPVPAEVAEAVQGLVLRSEQASSARQNRPLDLGRPLIGRSTDLDELLKILLGESGCVELIGESGIGKTRLVSELREQLGSLWTVIHTDCLAPAPPTLGWVFRDFESQLGALSLPPHRAMPAPLLLGMLFEAVRLSIAATTKRVLLVLDNAHAVSALDADLVGYLASSGDRFRLLIVNNPARAPRLHLERLKLRLPAETQKYVLGPLARRDALILASQFTNEDVSAVINHVGGNPYAIMLACGAYGLGAFELDGESRIVDPRTKQLVEAASVLGVRFRLEALRALVAEPTLTLSVLPSELLRLVPSTSEVEFVHEELRNRLYGALAPHTRSSWHRKVIERVPLQLLGGLRVLDHVQQAELHTVERIRVQRHAVELMIEEYQLDEALHVVRDLLREVDLDGLPEGEAALLLFAASRASETDREPRNDYARRAAHYAMRADDVILEAACLERLSGYVKIGESPPEDRRAIERVLERLPVTAKRQRIRLMCSLIVDDLWSLTLSGHHNAVKGIDQITALLDSSEPGQAGEVAATEALLSIGLPNIVRRRELSELYLAATGSEHYLAGLSALVDGDRREFLRVTDRLRCSRLPWNVAMAHQFGCLDSLLNREPDEAAQQANSMIETFPNDPNVLRMYWVSQYGIARVRGRVAELVDETAAIAAQNPSMAAFAASHVAALCRAQAFEEARPKLEALMCAEVLENRNFAYTATLALLAECCIDLDANDHSATLEPYLVPYRGQLLVAGVGCFAFGAVDRYLGAFAAARGDQRKATELFATARFIERRINAEHLVTETQSCAARFGL